VAELKPFAQSFRRRRCIISTEFFTQRRTVGEPKGRLFGIGMADGSQMLIAGIWDAWNVKGTDTWIRTFATITVPANDLVAEIHDRMPAILRGNEIDDWLNVREVRAREAYQLAMPLEDGALKFHPVSTRVNSARDDDSGLIEPAEIARPEPKPKKAAGGGQMSLF
jgi:putative SOS response-associated peptidase YedK